MRLQWGLEERAGGSGLRVEVPLTTPAVGKFKKKTVGKFKKKKESFKKVDTSFAGRSPANAAAIHSPFPPPDRAAAESLLTQFLAHEHTRGLGASALKLAVCGVRHYWISTPPFRDPSCGSQLVSKALVAFQKSVESSVTYAPALPPSALRHAFDISADPVVPFALTLAFVFFLRVSEYATTSLTNSRLTVKHITVTPRTLELFISVSKRSTKPSSHERATTAPTRWNLATLYNRYASTRRRSPADPALQWLDGSPVTDDDINRLIKALAARAGLPNPGAYSSHSLRAGGAVAALALGSDQAWILREGRWSSPRSLMLYIRTLAEPFARRTLDELMPGAFAYAW